jgi:hypothetical protein
MPGKRDCRLLRKIQYEKKSAEGDYTTDTE